MLLLQDLCVEGRGACVGVWEVGGGAAAAVWAMVIGAMMLAAVASLTVFGRRRADASRCVPTGTRHPTANS